MTNVIAPSASVPSAAVNSAGAAFRAARRFLQQVFVFFLFVTGSFWRAKRELGRSGAVLVLTLHRVLRDQDAARTHSLPGMILRESTFEALAVYLTRHYDVINLTTAVPGEARRRPQIAFTFDDGWEDNASVALPVVRKYRLPITVFICPALVGRVAPFWPEQVLALLGLSNQASEAETVVEQLKSLARTDRDRVLRNLAAQRNGAARPPFSEDRTVSWIEAANMRDSGVVFGAHSDTHQILTTVTGEEARREVRESKTAIERNLSVRCDLFAYPNGNHDAETRAILQQESYRLAFTTTPGAWLRGCDPLAIPRVNVSEENLVGSDGRFSRRMFEYTTVWRAWRAMKRGGATNAVAATQGVTG